MRTCHSASPARRRRPIQPCSGNGACPCARIETLGRKRRGSIVESGAARAIVAIDCTVTNSNGARSTNGLSGRAMNSKNSGGIPERSGVASPGARAKIAATSALASSGVPCGGLGAGALSHGHSVTSRPRNALRRLLASGSSAAKTSPVGSSISGTPSSSAGGPTGTAHQRRHALPGHEVAPRLVTHGPHAVAGDSRASEVGGPNALSEHALDGVPMDRFDYSQCCHVSFSCTLEQSVSTRHTSVRDGACRLQWSGSASESPQPPRLVPAVR